MKWRRFDILAVLPALLLTMVSCRQELCYDHYPVLDVAFTWEQEWERDYGMAHQQAWENDRFGIGYDELRPELPEWINMISYYDDGRRSDTFMSPDGKRFIVDEAGNRSILLYNGDTEYIVLSDVASLTDARATATSRSRSRASLAAMYQTYQNARTTNPPDILYAAFLENVPPIKNHELTAIPVNMQPLVYTYLVKFEFEYGLKYVALARGALGGMAEAVYLRTGVTSEDTAIILFDCDIKSDGCQASVHSFGVPAFPDIYYGQTPASTGQPYTLQLEALLTNGKTIIFNVDVSDQIKKQPRGGILTVGGLRVEDEQAQFTGGFNVEVSEWPDEPNEIIDVPLIH